MNDLTMTAKLYDLERENQELKRELGRDTQSGVCEFCPATAIMAGTQIPDGWELVGGILICKNCSRNVSRKFSATESFAPSRVA